MQIDLERYEELLEAEAKLTGLELGGVHEWAGYQTALVEFRQACDYKAERQHTLARLTNNLDLRQTIRELLVLHDEQARGKKENDE